MSVMTVTPDVRQDLAGGLFQQKIVAKIDDLIAALPSIDDLTAEQRRGMIARYTAVLEANFIYWMTATYLAVKSEDARPHLIENLHEEVKDSHPVMLRRFAMAAHAFPTDTDALFVDEDLTRMRLFLGKLQGVPSLASMAFFEAWIQKFMPYLADLAGAQGSADRQYTDVHGVCDIAHSEELFHAVSLEMELNPPSPDTDIYEGVELLVALIHTIVNGPEQQTSGVVN